MVIHQTPEWLLILMLPLVPIVMMTHEARERDMRQALREINRLSIVSGRTMYLRVEGDED